MSTMATEALTADESVKIARKQVDAFNDGDWEQMRAMLASDSRYDELGTEQKVEGPEKIVELFKAWKTAFLPTTCWPWKAWTRLPPTPWPAMACAPVRTCRTWLPTRWLNSASRGWTRSAPRR